MVWEGIGFCGWMAFMEIDLGGARGGKGEGAGRRGVAD